MNYLQSLTIMPKSNANFFLIGLLGLLFAVSANSQGALNPNLKDLPFVISWNDDGITISKSYSSEVTGGIFTVEPAQYLERLSNDIIKVLPGGGAAPVIIDMTHFYHPRRPMNGRKGGTIEGGAETIRIEMPKMILSSYSEPDAFIIELKGYSKNNSQTFLFRGLDAIFVGSGQCAEKFADGNKVILDVRKCDVKHLNLKGGMVDTSAIADKITNLCDQYNYRYFSDLSGEENGFICLEDCRKENDRTYKYLQHTRRLITKYEIVNFNDQPVAFVGEILFTEMGVGLKMKKKEKENKSILRFIKSTPEPEKEYYFFPWSAFINLNFDAMGDSSIQIAVEDPYGNEYVYGSKVYFSNVELIQFFNELKTLISDRLE